MVKGKGIGVKKIILFLVLSAFCAILHGYVYKSSNVDLDILSYYRGAVEIYSDLFFFYILNKLGGEE